MVVEQTLSRGMALCHYLPYDFNFSFEKKINRFVQDSLSSPARKKSTTLQNYHSDQEFSLHDLIFNKKRLQGYLTIEDSNEQILCGSGYYQINNFLLAGVRALSIPSSVQEHKFLHAAYILDFQMQLAKQRNLAAFVIAINETNNRTRKLMLHYARKTKYSGHAELEKAKSLLRDLNTVKEPMLFNNCKQFIFYKAFKNFSISSLDRYTHAD
jgi:hypothetical protein